MLGGNEVDDWGAEDKPQRLFKAERTENAEIDNLATGADIRVAEMNELHRPTAHLLIALRSMCGEEVSKIQIIT